MDKILAESTFLSFAKKQFKPVLSPKGFKFKGYGDCERNFGADLVHDFSYSMVDSRANKVTTMLSIRSKSLYKLFRILDIRSENQAQVSTLFSQYLFDIAGHTNFLPQVMYEHEGERYVLEAVDLLYEHVDKWFEFHSDFKNINNILNHNLRDVRLKQDNYTFLLGTTLAYLTNDIQKETIAVSNKEKYLAFGYTKEGDYDRLVDYLKKAY
jgi:hypothetical protein